MAIDVFKRVSFNGHKDFHPNLVSVQMWVMKINGEWPIDFGKYLPAWLSFLSKPLFVLYCIFWSFMALHISIFFLIAFLIKMYNNAPMPEASANFAQFIVYGFAFYTTAHFQWNHDKLAELFNFLFKNFKMRSTRGLTYVTIEPCYAVARIFTIIWTLSCLGAVFYYISMPIILQVWELPLECWYPFDYYPHPIFEIVFFSQIIGQIEVAVAYATSDVILITFVLFIYTQYDVLFCSLKNLRYTGMLIQSATKHQPELRKLQNQINLDDEERGQYYYSFERKEDLDDIEAITADLEHLRLKSIEQRLRVDHRDFLMEFNDEITVTLHECMVQHQNLMKICDLLERLYNPIVLVKSLQITLQLCNMGLVSMKATSSLLQNINYAIYFIMTMSDLLLYGYAGNWIQEQSIRVSDAILRAPWYLYSRPVRRSLLIIMSNTMKPLQLTGGKFFILDYAKVFAVLKATFSVFTLLQKMD